MGIERPPRLPPAGRAGSRIVSTFPLACLALAMLCVWSAPGVGAEPQDSRARTVESSLSNQSRRNDAAVQNSRVIVSPGTDVLGQPRVNLNPPDPTSPDRAVSQSVQSSLHKLRRETVNDRTPDGRKARVEESLDNQADPVDPG